MYQRQQLKYITWNADPDRVASAAAVPAEIKKQIKANLKDNTNDFIILFHDIKSGKAWPVNSFPGWIDVIVEGAKEAGVSAVFPKTQAQVNAFLARYDNVLVIN